MYKNKIQNVLKYSAKVLGRYCSAGFNSTLKITMENPPLKVTLSERLSSLIRPVNYKLYLHPDLKDGKFKGSVKITVNVKEEKKFMNLHTKFLNISEVKVFKDDTAEVPVAKYLEVKQVEQLLIHFENAVRPGTYQISINFDGDLTRNIIGFYLSRLKDNRTMVASKFQPTYARQAFPCFDEPEYKATYDITLVKPSGYTALSNMHEVSKTLDKDNLEAVTFATSVPMSTYLTCFVVCDFGNKEVQVNSHGIGNNFKLRAYAQKDQMHKIDFALDIGKRATEFYIKYYDVPFPLTKLDMIAIPDYQSGATEHWGLITYRETAFLMDEATSSVQNKISIANTIAHELAHMWFGNLVTLKWWDDIWLNEGFASYMQSKALHAINPSWTTMFVTRTLHPVLVTDAKLSSHPIVQSAESPDEITALFDSISYNKGASILRMLEGFIGEENFRLGISSYLKKYKYGNTVTQDLLTILESYFDLNNPGMNLTYVMDTWTRQMGYPLLTLTHIAEGEYEVKQSRFLLDPDVQYKNDSPFNYRWFIPITYHTNLRTVQNVVWFPDQTDSVTIKLNEGETWLKLNNDQVGYYRVNYPIKVWDTLVQVLKSGPDNKILSVTDRANLLDDVFALAESRHVPYDLALNLTTYLVKEKHFVPWQTAFRIFDNLKDKLQNTIVVEDLKEYAQSLVKPLYEEQSLEQLDADVGQRLLRSGVLSFATKMHLPDAVSKVRALFLDWLENHDKNRKHLEPDLRDVVYYYGMQPASLEEWEKLWKIYLAEEDALELVKLRTALAAPRDTTILKRYLTLAWDEKNVRGQDYLTVLHYISVNPSGTSLVWDEVRTTWPQLVKRFSLNSRYLGGLIPAITSSFTTELKLKEMEAFFSEYPEAGAGESARQRALETVRNNIQWVKTHEAPVTAWLHKHKSTNKVA